MADFNFITERIACGGGIVSEADVQQLKSVGITHVIDMRAEFDDSKLFSSTDNIEYLWLPQNDDGTPRSPDQILSGIKFAFTALSTPTEGKLLNKVYVHCAAGMNRGPTQCFAILRATGMPKDEAIQLLKSKRPVVVFYTTANYVNSVEALFT